MRLSPAERFWSKARDGTDSSKWLGRASSSFSSSASSSKAIIWLPRSPLSNLPLIFAMTSSWMTSAKSSYLKQMHSMEPVVSSRVKVAILVPRFVSFTTTFEIIPTNTALRISFVRSDRSPMVNFDRRASVPS